MKIIYILGLVFLVLSLFSVTIEAASNFHKLFGHAKQHTSELEEQENADDINENSDEDIGSYHKRAVFGSWAGKRAQASPKHQQDIRELVNQILNSESSKSAAKKALFGSWAGKRSSDRSYNDDNTSQNNKDSDDYDNKKTEKDKRRPWGGAPSAVEK